MGGPPIDGCKRSIRASCGLSQVENHVHGLTVCRASCRPDRHATTISDPRNKWLSRTWSSLHPYSSRRSPNRLNRRRRLPQPWRRALPMPPSLHLSLASNGCNVVYYAAFVWWRSATEGWLANETRSRHHRRMPEENAHIVAETAARIFADLADPQTIYRMKNGAWKEALWQTLGDAGLPLALGAGEIRRLRRKSGRRLCHSWCGRALRSRAAACRNPGRRLAVGARWARGAASADRLSRRRGRMRASLSAPAAR